MFTILLMGEPGALAAEDSALNAAWHMLNVPHTSISMTVLKPFGERFLAVLRKFPAAPFTTVVRRPYLPTVNSTSLWHASGERTSHTR